MFRDAIVLEYILNRLNIWYFLTVIVLYMI